MIRSFSHKETKKLFDREHSRAVPANLKRLAIRKMLILDAAETIADLRVPPANRLEKLKGDRKGTHSIRINNRYRICFRWHSGHAHDVEIVDYH